MRLALETPAERRWNAAVDLQRRVLSPLASPRHGRSDLASLRLKADEPRRGLRGRLNLEITGEGEYQKTRSVVYAGPGQGGYDELGNYVGTGDYDVVLVVSQALAQVARAATSARAEWQAPAQGRWRGTRAGFDFETETRRRGELKTLDPFLPPGAALTDPGLSKATRAAAAGGRGAAGVAGGGAAAARRAAGER